MSKKVIKTKGGFEIVGFTKLETPIAQGNIVEPHIYEGYMINFPYNENTIIKRYYLTWDRFGRCSNWKRDDCFIDVENL